MKFVFEELNSVHEALFGAVEEDNSKEHNNAKAGDAIEQTANGEGTNTEATIFECLKDGWEGIDVKECLVLGGSKAQRIDDRSGIHQELYTKADEHIQITVFRC